MPPLFLQLFGVQVLLAQFGSTAAHGYVYMSVHAGTSEYVVGIVIGSVISNIFLPVVLFS